MFNTIFNLVTEAIYDTLQELICSFDVYLAAVIAGVKDCNISVI